MLDEAIVAFNEAIRLERDFVEARNGLGILLVAQKKDLDAAAKVLQPGVEVLSDWTVLVSTWGP